MDEKYLASKSPIYRGFFGKQLAIFMLKLFGIDKFNALVYKYRGIAGVDFTSKILQDVGVSYRIINGKNLEKLPETGFITVSNHPFGSVDGVILIDIFARLRPDYKLMVNGILNRVASLKENFIGVEPAKGKLKSKISHNINGIRECIKHLKDHPMGFFPAGAISRKDYKTGLIEDREWQKGVLHIIKKSKLVIIPVFFDGFNSDFFYSLGRIHWKVRETRIAHEFFNKSGKCFNVVIGEPISIAIQEMFSDLESYGIFLKEKTYELSAIATGFER